MLLDVLLDLTELSSYLPFGKSSFEFGNVSGDGGPRPRTAMTSAGTAPWGHWLGSSLSSEPGGLTGLSVASHAGVLARSKISGSLLHRLSRPWHGLGPGGSHRDQRYGAAPKFSSPAAGCRSSSCLAIAASASSSSDFRCCSFILERRLAKQFSHDTKLLKLNQMRDGEGVKPVCAGPL